MKLFTGLSLATAAAASYTEESWFDKIVTDLPTTPVEAGKEVLTRVYDMTKDAEKKGLSGRASENAYFNFIPQFRGGVIPDGPAITWSDKCFAQNSAVAKTRSDTSVSISITSSEPRSDDCKDTYNVMSLTGSMHVGITEAGTYDFIWELPTDIRDAERWDLANKGVRLFHYETDPATTIANLLETVTLFVPEFTKQVDPISARKNVDFIAKYPQFQMESRDPLESLPPLKHKVHSGDFFGVVRLDGLDPMLAWAMGSTTGHTTTALWMDEELYIVESTVTDSYWPTNGIQKTPYAQWLKQAEEAGYNVVWAPLNKQYRAKFNEEAAVAFFKENEGFDYGYRNMLWGWIDTLNDNYPCVPDDYSTVCTSWEFFEPIFGILDRKAPELVDTFVNQAFNLRIGTSNLRLPEIFQTAAGMGIESKKIPTIVEQDSWVYNTTRNEEPAQGRSMVCCVFVCSTWKAAGLFDDLDVNCGEMTNADDYGLALFEDEYTQILGRWTLDLNRFNIKKPYEHMGETCSSLAPKYEQTVDC